MDDDYTLSMHDEVEIGADDRPEERPKARHVCRFELKVNWTPKLYNIYPLYIPTLHRQSQSKPSELKQGIPERTHRVDLRPLHFSRRTRTQRMVPVSISRFFHFHGFFFLFFDLSVSSSPLFTKQNSR